MIPKYRNRGVLQLALGFGLLLVAVFIAGITERGHYRQLGACLGVILGIVGYLIFVFGCTDLLKAKGYDSSLALPFVIPALCCSLLFIFVAPVIIVFGLKDKTGRQPVKGFSTRFLRRAAQLSWLCPTVGIVLTLICGSTHIRPLIGIVALVCSLVVILSLILGVVALCGVRKHGMESILIPSLFGVLISGVAVLFVSSALIDGALAAKAEWRQQHARMIESIGQTNAAPQPHTN